MATQLLIDLYECEFSTLNSMEKIRKIAHELVAHLGATLIKDCYHQFEPIGITYIAVISTSHFSIHTWPENGYAAIDIFSCSQTVPEESAQFLIHAFGAGRHQLQTVTRDIGE